MNSVHQNERKIENTRQNHQRCKAMKAIGVLSGFDDYDALSKENPHANFGSIAELFEAITTTPGGNDERHTAHNAEKFN